ncbi:MAG: SulP family inorganic anion transporter [Archangium sp.]|nr:SulP family inorganic anion transporter [Archangium sp.]MDP3573549.1 SulP family inorganic anion transporter [Archangium sp.]
MSQAIAGPAVPSLKDEWFGNARRDVVAGVVVALALIPEAIAFSLIAGVDPKIGLYASFCIAVVTSILGGRIGMISAATGATALVMGPLVKTHGLQYLLAATMLAGVLQLVFGALKLARYMRFVPRSVMTGYVNALAILIFMAQLRHFKAAPWAMYAMVAAGLAIIYLTPRRIAQVVPSPLFAITGLTAVAIATGSAVSRVGDMGALPTSLPMLGWPAVPLTFETLAIITPYSATLAMVGLLASLLCSAMLDDLTDTSSNKNREALAQGTANIVSGCFGAMAGCAMIGQSVLNNKLGGRGRLSSFIAGVLLLFLILVLDRWVRQIPMAAIVAVMFMVSIGTMDWRSLRRLPSMPRTEAIAMVATVATIVSTNNFALGVLVGAVLSALFFARAVSKLARVESVLEGSRRTYRVAGELFFGSVTDLLGAIEYHDHLDEVVIDLRDAHVWDGAAVAALDRISHKFGSFGAKVRIVGLNAHSRQLLAAQSTHAHERVEAT